MPCSKCGTLTNPPGQAFCGQCGSDLRGAAVTTTPTRARLRGNSDRDSHPHSQTFCPNCGTARQGAFRFCRSCGLDFDAVPEAPPKLAWAVAAPTTATPEAQSYDNPAATFAGIAWIICAALTGYLALLQFGTARNLTSLGLDPGDLQTFALWNGVAAAVTVYFGVRLLQRPRRGFVNTSTAWGVLSVGGGIVQIASGATNDIFLGSIVAAGVAGVLSLAARAAAPEKG
jgi:hypothetical protein